jgi:hypothetical protein
MNVIQMYMTNFYVQDWSTKQLNILWINVQSTCMDQISSLIDYVQMQWHESSWAWMDPSGQTLISLMNKT